MQDATSLNLLLQHEDLLNNQDCISSFCHNNNMSNKSRFSLSEYKTVRDNYGSVQVSYKFTLLTCVRPINVGFLNRFFCLSDKRFLNINIKKFLKKINQRVCFLALKIVSLGGV